MALKWKDVIAKPEYQKLPLREKIEAQDQYFNEVVAPQLPTNEVDDARQQFYSQYPAGSSLSDISNDPDASVAQKAAAAADNTFSDMGSGIGRAVMQAAENLANWYLDANAELNKIAGLGNGEYTPVNLSGAANQVYEEKGTTAQKIGEKLPDLGLALSGWGEGAEIAGRLSSVLPELETLWGGSKIGRFAAKEVPRIIESAGGSAGAQVATGNAPTANATAQDVALDRITHGIFSSLGLSMRKVRDLIGNPSEKVSKAAERIGIKPSLAVLSGDRGAQMIEDVLAKTPGGAGVIKKHYEQEFKGIDGFIQRMTDRFGGRQEDSSQLGEDILKGLTTFKREFSGKAEKLYDRLWEAFPKGTKVELNNFFKQLSEITGRYDSPHLAAYFHDPKITNLLEAIQSGAGDKEKQDLLYSLTGELSKPAETARDVKFLRTRLGAAIDNTKLLSSNLEEADIRSLYDALTKDIESAAERAGPKARQAWRNANNYWRAGRKRIDDYLEPLHRKNTGDAVYKSVFGSEGGNASAIDPQRAAALIKSLPEEARNKLVSEIIARLGEAKAGAQNANGTEFSPATFLTNWNKLSKGAKKVLFSDSETRADLDALATYSDAFKEQSKHRNFSNTGQYMTLTALLTHAAFSPLTGIPALASVAAGSKITAKMMSSPTFINWLRKSAESKGHDELARSVGKLLAIYWNHSDLQGDIENYVSDERE